jgi:antirestriction factor ArdC-like protein
MSNQIQVPAGKKSRYEIMDEQLQKIVKVFSSKEVVNTLTKVYYTATDKPSNKWSFSNQMIMYLEGTTDARGYQQWRKVGRQVQKGEKAIWILAPSFIDEVQEDGEIEKVLRGFRAVPVFKIESTDGEPVKEIVETPKLPRLMDVAEKLGAKIRFTSTLAGEWGTFNPLNDEIRLCTPDEGTMFHELVHLAQKKIFGLKTKDEMKEEEIIEAEVIAQLGACVLGNLYGLDISGYTYNYISQYIGSKDPDKVGKACFGVLSKVGKILNYILKTDEELNGGEKDIQ